VKPETPTVGFTLSYLSISETFRLPHIAGQLSRIAKAYAPTKASVFNPELIASEACHHLALSEGQKENKWKNKPFHNKTEVKDNG
jgi:hypothetical protein